MNGNSKSIADTINWQNSLPKKRMGAGAILFNNGGQLLLVKPTYKDHWSYVGGVVDANESPKEALIREVREEIGLDIRNFDLVCIGYHHDSPENTESLQFKFTTGPLTEEQLSSIRLDAKELESYKFVSEDEARKLLTPRSYEVLQKCLVAIRENKAIYLE